MSGKHLDQWSGNQSYDYNSDEYSYSPPSHEVIQPGIGYLTSAFRVEDNQINNYEQSWRSHDRNRQTGTYTSQSTKAVASHGDTFKERSTGRVGSKDEFKTTSTYRVGDKSGYSEYQYQERYRRVDFGDNDGSSSRGSGSKGGYANKYLK